MPINGPRLGDLYPELPFAAQADVFLEHVRATRSFIEEQLGERKIVRIERKAIFSDSGIVLENGQFRLWINDVLEREKWPDAIGCEIGRTFAADPSGSNDQTIADHQWNRFEEFLEMFAEKWVAINGRRNIMALLKTGG